MSRTTSVVRRVNFVDHARHHVREVPCDRYFNRPQCQACAIPLWNPTYERWTYDGPELDRVEVVHGNDKQIFIRAICDAPGHSGNREDVIRVDFEHKWDEEDLVRALQSCVFFRRDSQADNVK